jgi:hypothetical protein
MDKKKEGYISWFSWGSNFIYLWYSSNVPTIRLRQGICSLWGNIRNILYYLGSSNRQKEAR